MVSGCDPYSNHSQIIGMFPRRFAPVLLYNHFQATFSQDRSFGHRSTGVDMELIQQSLMQWGEAMQLTMENRSLFYSPVLKHWRVKKWAGKDARKFLYDGENFDLAFEYFLGSRHSQEDPKIERS